MSGENGKEPRSEIKKPSTLLPGLTRLVIGLVCMVGYLNFSPRFPLPALYKSAFIASTPFYKRVCHLLLAMLGERFKYYFAWKVAEGASILGGFGFEGYEVKKTDDGKEKHVAKGWAGVENIDIVAFETAYNSSLASRAWNKRTQGWLERYTYFRSGKSLYATYFVSAVWHGLYPGFFFVFFSIAIITEVERLVRAKLNPLLVPSWGGKPTDPIPPTPVAYAYWGMSWLCFVLSLNYAAQVFCMGSLERSLSAYGGSMWFGHVGMVVVYVLMLVLPGAKKDKKDKGKKE
ncbi:hypothetical protein EON63_12860 [archaeon]|nr:MAG: hypothetical protein EON63_12860 [archaeon]